MGWLPRWLLVHRFARKDDRQGSGAVGRTRWLGAESAAPGGVAAAIRVSTVPFKLKYGYFRELLQANDQVLEFIADLEDILAGKLVLDPPVVRSRLDKAALTTFVMVKNLNLISDGRYPGLYTALERIHGAVERELAAGD